MPMTRLETLQTAAARAAVAIEERAPAMGEPLYDALESIRLALSRYGETAESLIAFANAYEANYGGEGDATAAESRVPPGGRP